MIKRSSGKVSQSVVNAATSETVSAVLGIKTDAPVVNLESATDIVNFDVNSNGTLTLRDPIVYVESPTTALRHEYIFDNNHQLRITRINATTPRMEIILDTPDGGFLQVYLRYTTIEGEVKDEIFTKNIVLNWEDCQFLHATSSTIIAKALVNLTLIPEVYNEDLMSTEQASSVFRYLNLFFDTDKQYWVIELLSPEVNTVLTASNSFDANVTLDNIYSVRDLYNYGKASVTGILPYMFKTDVSGAYSLISTVQLNITLWQGLFSLKVYKSEYSTSYALSTKVPMSITDFNQIYTSQLTSDKVKTFFNDIDANNTLSISLGSNVTQTFTLGYFIPANTTIATGVVLNDISTITITLPTNLIYCYPKGTDFEYFKDTIASKITLDSNTYTYDISDLDNFEGDIFEKELNEAGFSLDFYNSEFQLVKHTKNSNFRYIQCVQDPTLREYPPDYFIFNKSYGSFKANTTFYIWKFTSALDFSDTLNSLKVCELTESVNNPNNIYLVDSFNNNETRPIVLKALITTPTDKSLNYYCNWEESDDGGLTWKTASAFIEKFKHKLQYIPKDILNRTDETLEDADDYITYTEVVSFNPVSENDLVSERPDILYALDFNTSKRYKFNIYYSTDVEDNSQIDMPDFYTTIAYSRIPQIECPKYKNWQFINPVYQVNTSNGLQISNIDISMHNYTSQSEAKDYTLVIQSSTNLRKEIPLTAPYTTITPNNNFEFTIDILSDLEKLLHSIESSHVVHFTYWVTYKSKKIKNSTGNILYYHSNFGSDNYNYRDYTWALTGGTLARPKYTNVDPELRCNILSESATITTGSNKTTSLDILESTDVRNINIENIKKYADSDIQEFEYADYVGKSFGMLNKEASYYNLRPSDYIEALSYYVVARYFNNTGTFIGTEVIPTSDEFKVTNVTGDILAQMNLAIEDSAYNTLLTELNGADLTDLFSLNNKVYKDGTTYKKVVFKETGEEEVFSTNITSSTHPELYQAITATLTAAGASYTNGSILCWVTAPMYTLALEEVDPPTDDSSEYYGNLICASGKAITLTYSAKFILYNNSNRPKIVRYFIERPNTSIYIDTRAEENANDTIDILPPIKSGNVSVTFKNITRTSEIKEERTSSTTGIGEISTTLSYDNCTYITIPAHSSIDGEVTYTCNTEIDFTYWAISLAARMFLALMFQTVEGFAILTSKGTTETFPWTNHIWANYTFPSTYLVFSDPEYANENLNGESLKLYNFQSLPKFLSKDYAVNSTGIRAHVLANQLEYASTNTTLDKTKLITKTNIDISSGEFLYYDNRVFVYNIPNHINSIYISNVDSFISPLNNALEITFGHTITKIIPWRNYLIVFTKNTTHLVAYTEDLGYTSKILNTSIGVPYIDRDTPVTILNSLIFKSGSKVYKLIPNLYTTSDSILNITCISSSIDPYLENLEIITKEFAFSTYDEYVLCCSHSDTTTVFKYNYNSKIWTKHVYPIKFTDFKYISIDEIYVYNGVKKYTFNKSLESMLDAEVYNIIPYGDYLNTTVDELATYTTENPLVTQEDCTPISFKLEFRQKSSNYQLDKQFLESKYIFAVESSKPVFPMSLDIVTDNMLKVIHKDVNTDSPLWQDSLEQLGVLNTLFGANTSIHDGTLKQLFVKYSGKGKTISHSISGKSISKFTFYNINYRYRLLPKKQ